ncbi:MAG: HpsJ family protein [Cyanobacteriota bacterium]|nr:HpsJ family protein [Cyanobacteriota bacterium]
MKVPNTNPIPSQAAQFLKLAGLVLILFALLNYILLLFPFNLGDVEWRLRFTTQLVDRGILPILGIALMFTAYGFEDILGISKAQPKIGWNTLKFWVYLISLFLGIIFLLLIPLHVTSAIAGSNLAIERVNQDAADAKEQLDERLEQQQAQIADLLASNQRVEDFTGGVELTEEQSETLDKFKNDPEALKVQTTAIRSRLTEQIEARRQQAQQRSQNGAFKSIVRTGISSLLLASCYLTIGWSGFRGNRPRRPRR